MKGVDVKLVSAQEGIKDLKELLLVAFRNPNGDADGAVYTGSAVNDLPRKPANYQRGS